MNCKDQNDTENPEYRNTRFVSRQNSVLPDFISFIIISTKRVTVTRRASTRFKKIKRAVVNGDISG